MKFLCPACDRLSELRTYRLDAGSLALKCDRCGNESRTDATPAVATGTDEGRALGPVPSQVAPVVPLRIVSAAAPAQDEDPLQPPEGHCPKCIAPQPEDALACATCGLVFANFNPADSQPSAAIAERWRALMPRWHEPLAHDEVLKGATATGQLSQVGRLYRIQLARRPDDPLARRGRDEVIRLASAASALVAAREQLGVDGGRRDTARALWVGALALLLLLGLAAVTLRSLFVQE